MEKLTRAIEDYLESVLIIKEEKKRVKAIDIAHLLDVSKPAVTKALNELIKLEYIVKENNNIELTKKGKSIANKTYKKHKLLKDFFIKLGVSEKTAENDCCQIEHVISDETIKQIKEFMDK